MGVDADLRDAKDSSKTDSHDTNLEHETLDATSAVTNVAVETVESDTSFGSSDSSEQSDESQTSRSSGGDHVKGGDTRATARKLHVSVRDPGYSLVYHELVRTRQAGMSPQDVWNCLYALAEKHSIDSTYILEYCLLSYAKLVTWDGNREFFSYLCNHYVKFCQDPRTRFHVPGCLYPNKTFTPMSEAFLRLLIPISRLQEIVKRQPLLKASDDQYIDSIQMREKVEQTCLALGYLIVDDTLSIEDMLSFLENHPRIESLDEMYRSQIAGQIDALRLEKKSSSVDESSYSPLISKFRCWQEMDDESSSWKLSIPSYKSSHNRNLSWRHPLLVWVVSICTHSALYSNGAKAVDICLERHPSLALAFPPLRAPLLMFLRKRFDKEELPLKFSTLLFIAKTLGPHFGQDPDFFFQACKLCDDHLETHRDSVFQVLTQLILPAFSFLRMESGRAVALVWYILSKIDLETRCHIYKVWLDLCNTLPALKAVSILLQDDISTLMLELSVETMDSVGRKIVVIPSRCPLIAWKRILLAEMRTNDKIHLLAYLFRTVSHSFAKDTLMFVIYDLLNDTTLVPPFEDGVHPHTSYKHLSWLTGHLFADVDYLQSSWLVKYVTFLAEEISTSASRVFLLQDLLTCMFGGRLTEFIDSGIAALSGSNLLKREVLLPTTDEMLLRMATEGNKISSAGADAKGFDGLHRALPSSVKAFFAALHHNHLFVRIVNKLDVNSHFRDISPQANGKYHAKYVFCVTQILFNVNVASAITYPYVDGDAADIISDLMLVQEKPNDVSLMLCLIAKRMSLRSQIDSHCLDFVNDMEQWYTSRVDRKGLDPVLCGFFWSLETYDVHVPESEYIREAARIETLNKGNQRSPQVDAAQVHLLDCLKASHAAHEAHVAWILPQLPKLKVESVDTLMSLILLGFRRAEVSRIDAHFAFCFITRILDDSVPFLDLLFDTKGLLAFFQTQEDYKEGVAGLLYEVWRDLNLTWPRQHVLPEVEENGMKPNGASATKVDRKVTRTCTLFRQGMDVVPLLQHWEKNTMIAVTAALNSGERSLVISALITICRLMYVMGPCRYLADVELPKLAEGNEDSEVAALARNVHETYKTRLKSRCATDNASVEQETRNCSLKRRKADADTKEGRMP